MAMRVRTVNGHVVALCAAEYPAEEGDLYIDDGQDHAIRVKLEADWRSEGYMFDILRGQPNCFTTGHIPRCGPCQAGRTADCAYRPAEPNTDGPFKGPQPPRYEYRLHQALNMLAISAGQYAWQRDDDPKRQEAVEAMRSDVQHARSVLAEAYMGSDTSNSTGPDHVHAYTEDENGSVCGVCGERG